jgi:phosphatidylinositol kinase/protein kinase (PI-3  family)
LASILARRSTRPQLYVLILTVAYRLMNIELQHLPVPELIPIRLTRQLTELMSPIGTAGLFRAIMIHTMNALRDNADLLLSMMDVFIKEPLSEWMVSFVSDSSRFMVFFAFMHRNKHSERADKRVSRI